MDRAFEGTQQKEAGYQSKEINKNNTRIKDMDTYAVNIYRIDTTVTCNLNAHILVQSIYLLTGD